MSLEEICIVTTLSVSVKREEVDRYQLAVKIKIFKKEWEFL